MQYIAHLREDHAVQPLIDHLQQVAELAAGFAARFGAEEEGREEGKLHDLGKYGQTSQRHMQDPEHTSPCDHSTAGAQQAWKMQQLCIAFAVAGHHAGLPDLGSKVSMERDSELQGRMKRKVEDVSAAWTDGLKLSASVKQADWFVQMCSAANKNLLEKQFAAQLYIRMLFSCLVDADYLDTEAFLQPDHATRGAGDSMETLLDAFLQSTKEKWKSSTGALNDARSKIFDACLAGGALPAGLFTLTVPTGGGKTTASMAFALQHAVMRHKRRVIYVIPYTSIIEQNASVFRDLLGGRNVLEHHSAVDTDAMNQEEADRWQLACENWDAPVVVTTAVQFFESLFACRPGRCRKLHNITDSVVIFDEAQMLPLNLLKACVYTIAELTRHYGVSAVLCTATQPALDDVIHEYAPDLPIRELCPITLQQNPVFQRVRFQWESETNAAGMAARMAQEDQCLCIVNTRKTTREIYRQLPEDGRFHLSTLMTQRDREQILQTVRDRLSHGLVCRLVSTSLVECGVDLSFPSVWRELAGLDSILQAAGRCNRNAEHSVQESVTHIFKLEGDTGRQYRLAVSCTNRIQERFGNALDSQQAITDYFQYLRMLMGQEKLDSRGLLEHCKSLRFRAIAENFCMIGQDTVPVVISHEDNRELIEQLRAGVCNRTLMRRLMKDIVNLYRNEVEALMGERRDKEQTGAVTIERGQCLERIDGRICILTDPSRYSPKTGLDAQFAGGNAIFE